jgi:hypothetical protein
LYARELSLTADPFVGTKRGRVITTGRRSAGERYPTIA